MAFGGGYFKTSYEADLALVDTRLRRAAVMALVVGLLLLPRVASSFVLDLASQVALAAIGALALNVLTGLAGQISLGHAGFLAAGAFTTAALVERGLASMQADGAQVYELPREEKLKWLNGMPNIARQWAEATEQRGIPADEILGVYMDALRSRGAVPLRDWDRESE